MDAGRLRRPVAGAITVTGTRVEAVGDDVLSSGRRECGELDRSPAGRPRHQP
uniref:Uncharacterized protein n=1 Tax=uncultured bacterium pTW3 TaxID=504467 RepID=B8PZX4_9BACT|nr:hypothetical protein [uncultured bacterium pTW3]